MELPIDGSNIILNECDRVYTYDVDQQRIYGTLKRNYDETTMQYKWFVAYDDRIECYVLDFDQIFKAYR